MAVFRKPGIVGPPLEEVLYIVHDRRFPGRRKLFTLQLAKCKGLDIDETPLERGCQNGRPFFTLQRLHGNLL